MKKRKQRRPGAFAAVAWRITALFLALYLAATGYITITAMTDVHQQFCSYAESATRLSMSADDPLPGYDRYLWLQNMAIRDHHPVFYPNLPLMDPHYPETTIALNERDPQYLMAMIYFDGNGDPLLDYGRYAFMAYNTQKEWFSGSEQSHGYTYIDLDKTPDGKELADRFTSYNSRFWPFSYYGGKAMRLTGYFEGDEFHLVGLADCFSNHDTVYNPKGLRYGELDQLGQVQWTVRFDNSHAVQRPLETIYTDSAYTYGSVSEPVRAGGETFDSLKALLKADLPRYLEGKNGYGKLTLTDAVIIRYRTGTASDGTGFRIGVAFRYNPLTFTAQRLWKVYLLLFLPMALGVLLVLLRIRRSLLLPVRQVIDSSRKNPLPLPEPGRSRWREAAELEDHYTAAQQALHQARLEVQQLSTSLDYAKNAEENRRKMIANITHELKTPLAVIHSYAEGLQEGIAGDRQDQYLSIILEETERMDAMVLEMLDLSRLEAGRVQLASDQFSLLDLTKDVFNRLARKAEEKRLKIHFDLTEDFRITADEARLSQVVTNFATNAIKYTPQSGSVWIQVYRHRNQSWLSIENECEGLSPEALSRVWDSFYRVDPARSEKGTGLGLTIAKTIVELHGGTCYANATANGVQFRFSLP